MNASWKRGFDVARIASMRSVAPRRARKLGAALYAGSNLLSIGFNTYDQSHTKAGQGQNIHAELRAILRRRWRGDKGNLIMYVYRELANGVPANSTPCSNCFAILREAGIRTVRFTDKFGRPVEEKL